MDRGVGGVGKIRAMQLHDDDEGRRGDDAQHHEEDEDKVGDAADGLEASVLAVG